MTDAAEIPQADNKLSILCVEGDPDMTQIIDLSLQLDGGFDTQFVATGRDALTLLSDTDHRPDCILVEDRLADTNGRRLLSDIRQMSRHVKTPIIFLSAIATSASAEAYETLGVLGTIAKPFNPLTLAQQILQILS